jgi:hypothetical protein
VKEFASSIGVQSADGTTFDPGWIVWLPFDGLVPASVDLTVGAPAPAAGTRIVTAEAKIGTAVMSDAPDTGGSSDQANDSEARGQANQSEPAIGLPAAIKANPDEVLTVATREIALEANGEIGEAGIAQLEALIAEDSDSVAAQLSKAASEGEFTVPAAAVVSASGQTCVVLAAEPHQTRTIEIRGARAGLAIVVGDLRLGDSVLVAPPKELRQCG